MGNSTDTYFSLRNLWYEIPLAIMLTLEANMYHPLYRTRTGTIKIMSFIQWAAGGGGGESPYAYKPRDGPVCYVNIFKLSVTFQNIPNILIWYQYLLYGCHITTNDDWNVTNFYNGYSVKSYFLDVPVTSLFVWLLKCSENKTNIDFSIIIVKHSYVTKSLYIRIYRRM